TGWGQECRECDAPPATDSVGASQPDAGADRGAGTSAKCVITGFNPTGEIWQGRSAIELDVRVTRPDGSVFAPGSRTTRTRSSKPSLAWSSTLRTCLVAKKIFSSPPR